MGEGPDRMSPEEPVGRAAHEIDVLRGEIGDLVDELDRRRHEALDVGLQVRRHPAVAIGAVVAVGLVAGGLLALGVRARRRRTRPAQRARALGKALSRMSRHPEEFAREPGIGERVLAAAATVAATTLVKQVVQRAVRARA